MWESPIEAIQTEIRTEFEDNCLKAVQSYGFFVNKEKLVKALNYDRKQYEKGYADGYAKAVDDFLEEMENWNSQIKFMRNESAFFTIENVREVAEHLKGVQE